MATLYRKSAKGIAEIETRAHRLAPRLRSALILVDGRRSDDDLRTLLQQNTDETLLSLVADGFIEVVSVSDAPGPRATAPAPGAARVPAAGAAAPPASITLSDRDLATVRRDAVRALTDELGPLAESVALRIERSRSFDELRPLLQRAAQMVETARGAAAAQVFRNRFLRG